MYRVSFVFAKFAKLKFISHLDLMRLFASAFRRADLPVKMTEGFSPHPKFSVKKALKLGLESESEEAEVILKDMIRSEDFKSRLQEELPEGISIQQATIKFLPR
jgi:radical SAM-linked protein